MSNITFDDGITYARWMMPDNHEVIFLKKSPSHFSPVVAHGGFYTRRFWMKLM
jgi:hypothetical protein